MSVTPLRKVAPIGGSEAAAACGIDPYMSKVYLWLVKTGKIARPETDAMHWGKLLEPVIFGQLEADYDVIPAPAEGLTDPERDWLHGHPDGFVTLDHERAVLEVKTASVWAHRGWEGVPLHYVAQVQTYLHLTGLRRALLACLVGGQKLEVHEIVRDEHAIEVMLDLLERFHRHLVTGTPPAPDGSESAREAVLTMFPHAQEGERIRLDSKAMGELRELRARKAQRDAIDRQIAEHENRLRAFMGSAEVAVTPTDHEAIRWTNVSAARIDTKRLRHDRPEIAEEYTATTSTRRFTLL